MMEGNIKSFLESKGYGFIDGNDGKSYFFHISDVLHSNENIVDGSIVDFIETATSKGYRAVRVKILSAQNSYNSLLDDFIWSRKSTPKKYTNILSIQLECSDKSIDNAKAKLKELALVLGFNSVVNVQYYKNTDSAGNYNFSVHHFKGDCSLLARKVACNDPILVQEEENKNLNRIKMVKSNLETYYSNLAKQEARRKRNIILLILAILPILIYFSLDAINVYKEELAIQKRLEQHHKK